MVKTKGKIKNKTIDEYIAEQIKKNPSLEKKLKDINKEYKKEFMKSLPEKEMSEIISDCWDLKDLVCRTQRLTEDQQTVIKNHLKSHDQRIKEEVIKEIEGLETLNRSETLFKKAVLKRLNILS